MATSLVRRGRKLLPGLRGTFAGELGNRLRVRRLELGLSVDDVSMLLSRKICSDAILNWERGEAEPRVSDWLALCKVLALDPFTTLPVCA